MITYPAFPPSSRKHSPDTVLATTEFNRMKFRVFAAVAFAALLQSTPCCGFQRSPYVSMTALSLARQMTASTEGPAKDITVPEQQQKPPDMAAYSSGYQTVFEEQSCMVLTPSFGDVPVNLGGTYYRCGPSMFSAGSIVPPKTSIIQPKSRPVPDGQDPDRMVLHPFEADGGLLAVTINQDTKEIVSRFRYIRTNAFTAERKKGQRLYTGMDSTRASVGGDLISPTFRHHLQPGLNKNRKNTSNTRVVFWAKKLLTLWEGGLPYKLNELALSTEGRSQLGGVLKEADPFGGAAKYDSKKDRMVFYGNKQDAGGSELTIFEFNNKFRLTDKTEVKLPGFALISDFGLTENYVLVVQPPVTANGMQFLFNKEPAKVLKLESGPSTLHIISRDESKPMTSVVIPFDGMTEADLQFVNAFEDADGTIIFDAIRMDTRTMDGKPSRYPWATSLERFRSTTAKREMIRYTVTKQRTITKQVLMDSQCYFGTVNPSVSAHRHRYCYSAIGALGTDTAPPQGIAKLDTTSGELRTWMPAEYEFCGEPMFAPSTGESIGEDDGYVLTVLYNGKANMSELVILAATDLSIQTRIPLGMALPHGLYGCFSPGDKFSAEEIDRRAKLADKMESRGNMWNEVKSDFSGLGLRLDDLEEYFGDMM